MASSDSQTDKPQSGRPKKAELLGVNINTGVQSINTERAFNSTPNILQFCLRWEGWGVLCTCAGYGARTQILLGLASPQNSVGHVLYKFSTRSATSAASALLK